jgi:RNA polymerase sigma-70 factor (ECF subfamily)
MTLSPSIAASSTKASPGPAAGDAALVKDALAGDVAAMDRLAALLMPAIQGRVARVLLRRRGLYGGDARARLEDLVQDTFVELFRDGGRVLRAWDPGRGLGLAGFAGLVAEQRVYAFLRSRKASARLEDLEDGDGDGAEIGARPGPDAWDPEARAASREHVEKVLDHLRAELSPMGRVMFERLLLNDEAIADVAADTGMSVSAVQVWSSRLRRRIAVLSEEIVVGNRKAAKEETP